MAKTVFVTGGAGYVGSHCCKAFADAGWEVVTFDNLSRGWPDLVKWGRLIEGDLLAREAIGDALKAVRPDAVAHFAALAYVGESVEDPGLYYRNNVTGTLNLLEAMVETGVDKLIFSSTCATYGIPERVPMAEETEQLPINPYGRTKLVVEQMLDDFGRAHGLRAVKLRYFNAAGADHDLETGERHEPETHLIPLAIQGQLTDGFELTVFGDDFDTRDGTCVRDYIHVADLADAHARALDYLQDGGASDAFNLGTGTGTTVLEIVAAVEKVSGSPVKRTMGPRREGDPPALVAAADKARETLGWVPRHSDIETIIATAWAWHQKEANTKR
jgi:UDP-arabinose 4-epimerase